MSAMIEATPISRNPYAPSGADAVNLYSTTLADSLTLGQLVMAVTLRAAASYEAQSVVRMNEMTAGSQTLSDASKWMADIANEEANWNDAKSFMVNTLGIDASTLPSDLSTYDNRMVAIKALKGKIDAYAQSQQEMMIGLQSLVSRRDVAYSTSSNVVRALGSSMGNGAAVFTN